jgi:leucyl/phenylalanyl-tRNA---protein transferase
MSRRNMRISPELVVQAYRQGLFPMAETRLGDRIYWLDPEYRGILPLDGFHLSRRLRRTVKSDLLEVAVDRDFPATIAGCAAPAHGRADTWINPDIRYLFTELYRMGYAHSVECWRDGVLVGGLYGVAIGGAFFGESMFSRVRDASKVALVHLVVRLRLGGFTLLDTQFITEHLAQFGAIEIPRDAYRDALTAALDVDATWLPAPDPGAFRVELDALLRQSACHGSGVGESVA